MENEDKKDLHTVASFVHGALFSLHALGLVYNLKRKNYKVALFHFAAASFDLVSTKEHIYVATNKKESVNKK